MVDRQALVQALKAQLQVVKHRHVADPNRDVKASPPHLAPPDPTLDVKTSPLHLALPDPTLDWRNGLTGYTPLRLLEHARGWWNRRASLWATPFVLSTESTGTIASDGVFDTQTLIDGIPESVFERVSPRPNIRFYTTDPPISELHFGRRVHSTRRSRGWDAKETSPTTRALRRVIWHNPRNGASARLLRRLVCALSRYEPDIVAEIRSHIPDWMCVQGIIGSSSFQGCFWLHTVVLPQGLHRIEDSVFMGCSSLQRLELPDSITSIGPRAFRGTGLRFITLPRRLAVVDQEVFSNCLKLVVVQFQRGLLQISDKAFCGCTSLRWLELPQSLELLGQSAFSDCTALSSAVLPPHVIMEPHVFHGCAQLSHLHVTGPICKVPPYAFARCTALRKVCFPAPVSVVGHHAFFGCTALTEILGLGHPCTVGRMAFGECPLLCCDSTS